MFLPLILTAMIPTAQPDIQAMLAQVDPKRMRATVEKLATWNTRNVNTPELTEAANWIAGEYRNIPGIQVEMMDYGIHKSRRVPADKTVVQVLARLPGVASLREPDSARIIVVGGHLDTINLAGEVMTGRAPGADDDASGAALALELARIMSQYKWKQTIIFCAWSGEEQGLLGSAAMAKRARDEGWRIDGVLSNDIVGSSQNLQRMSDPHHVRLFSEEVQPAPEPPRASLTPPNSPAGGPAIPLHNSREMGRYIEFLSRGKIKGFSPMLVFRRDRYGRGGDHSSFNEQGFNAVRFVEVYEEYTHQHTAFDLPQFMDWNYLANVTRLNLLAAASLANADEPPTVVKLDLKQSHDTTLTWKGMPGTKYVVYWRLTTSPTWTAWQEVGTANHATIKNVSHDDYVFAVGAEGGIPVTAR